MNIVHVRVTKTEKLRKNGWSWESMRGCNCVYACVCVSIPGSSRKLIDSYYSSLAHRFRDCESERENDDGTKCV